MFICNLISNKSGKLKPKAPVFVAAKISLESRAVPFICTT